MQSTTQRTWPVFLGGIGTMLLLILLPGIAAFRQSAEIYDEIRALQRENEEAQDALSRIERQMLQVSVTVREFLLDDSPVTSYLYREQVAAARRAVETALLRLAQATPQDQAGRFDQLRMEIENYWRSVTPVFNWSPAVRKARATYFLREQQRPRRAGIVAIADEIGRLSRESYRRRYEETNLSQGRFRGQLQIAIALAFALGLGVAAWTAIRIATLERHASAQKLAATHAEQQMRSLSTRLMQAQEDERRTIARELHDEVGQTLTGLRFELGALERLNGQPAEQYRQHLEEAKTAAEHTLRTVRDIAAGLRPSVLDLGLVPALQSQARNFSRMTGTDATVRVEGLLPALPDAHLTCIYRIVQEALTNSARHARARSVDISVTGSDHALELVVTDDGVGLPDDWDRRRGMGLIGIGERAREIGGVCQIGSRPAGGATIRVRVPVPDGEQP